MSDDLIKEWAKEIITEVVNKVEFSSNFGVSEVDGTWEFAIEIITHFGNASVIYRPQQAVEQVIRKLEEEFTEAWEGTVWDGPEEYESIRRSMVYEKAADITEILLKQLYSEFEDTVQNMADIAYMQAECVEYELSRKLYAEEDLKVREASEKVIGRNLKSLNKRRKARMMRLINESREEIKFDLSKLKNNYKELLPTWKEAKKTYKQIKKLKHWREALKQEYREHSLPEDLIERLASLDSYDSTPSAIALEHASRLCGVPDNHLSTRTLYGYLAKASRV